MTSTVAISDARAKLPDLITKIDKNLDRAIITVNGKPKAVILSFDELESLEETAEVLSTMPGIKREIEESRKQIKKGQFTPLSKIK